MFVADFIKLFLPTRNKLSAENRAFKNFQDSLRGEYGYSEFDGITYKWFNDKNALHSVNDQPSIITDHYLLWHDNGKQHRADDRPATIYTMDNSFDFGKSYALVTEVPNMKAQAWYANDKLHRVNGPASIIHTKRKYRAWYQYGMLHRIGGPAAIDQTSQIVVYAVWGEYHRLDGPAYISPHLTEWYLAGQRHRVGKPAVIRRHQTTGKVCERQWYFYNWRHRLDGPAVESSFGEGEYYWFGEKLTYHNYTDLMKWFSTIGK